MKMLCQLSDTGWVTTTIQSTKLNKLNGWLHFKVIISCEQDTSVEEIVVCSESVLVWEVKIKSQAFKEKCTSINKNAGPDNLNKLRMINRVLGQMKIWQVAFMKCILRVCCTLRAVGHCLQRKQALTLHREYKAGKTLVKEAIYGVSPTWWAKEKAGQELGSKQPGLLVSGYSSRDNQEEQIMSKLGKQKI